MSPPRILCSKHPIHVLPDRPLFHCPLLLAQQPVMTASFVGLLKRLRMETAQNRPPRLSPLLCASPARRRPVVHTISFLKEPGLCYQRLLCARQQF
jgi:hypothetical protein